ncbi:hypothetical protein BCR33DRAFT_720657 [Rhizoclosmatium globosum]|uniref:BSD domain-containing protein n=1 Tax=Rhizoclosmatium globosum TaxID=329046 RepID=A0A1Y2BVJ0_9FUNG|nr:hypothetical protein BCR33DRAFT_720657 [Rhizoclosmatium globosum]|eukprot:ORY38647.1 hypothetical protein BCR33DRAFT_720657 [Rhizoclosmatium globosum]
MSSYFEEGLLPDSTEPVESSNNSSSGWGWGSMPSWNSIVDTVKKQTDVVATVLERDISEFITVVAPPTNPSSSQTDLTEDPSFPPSTRDYEPVFDPTTGMLLNAQEEGNTKETSHNDQDPLNPISPTSHQVSNLVETAITKLDTLVDQAEDFLEHVDVSNRVHKIVDSVNVAETVQQIENIADKAEDFLESVETGVWNFLGSAMSKVSLDVMSLGGTSTGVAKQGKANIIFDRKTATILALRHNAETFTVNPTLLPSNASPAMKDVAEQYIAFATAFEISVYSTQIARLLDEDAEVRTLMSKIVPSTVSYEEFWTRYFFRVQQVDREEEARKKLMNDATLTEEEVGWGDDSDEDEIEEQEPATAKPSLAQAPDATPKKSIELVKPIAVLAPTNLVGPVSITEAVESMSKQVSPDPSDRSSFDVVSDQAHAESVAGSEVVIGSEEVEENQDEVDVFEDAPVPAAKVKPVAGAEDEEEEAGWGDDSD